MPRRKAGFWPALAGLLLATLLALPGAPRAQAPAAPAAPAAAPGAAPQAAPGGVGLQVGEIQVRVALTLIDQLSFTKHPFYQITEDPGYLNGKAITAYLFSVGNRNTAEDENFVQKAFHALPPLGIEGVMKIDLPMPRGFGFGFDYTPLIQTDVNAAKGVASVTAIQMDAYFYSGVLRFYVFDPTAPGINYFTGFGLGLIDGKIRSPFSNGAVEYNGLSQFPVGSLRLGLEAKGDSWGFRYEMMLLNATEVRLDSNPYNDRNGDGPNSTSLDFSGSLIRLNLFFQF